MCDMTGRDSAPSPEPEPRTGAHGAQAPGLGPEAVEAPRGTQTLVRGLAVVQAVADGARSLAEISATTELSRSTVHRLAQGLLRERVLTETSRGHYRLGGRLISWGGTASAQNPVIEVARPVLEQLSETSQDTVHLACEDSGTVLYLHKIDGRRGAAMRSRVGGREPLTRTGVGKALLLDEPDRWAQLARSEASPQRVEASRQQAQTSAQQAETSRQEAQTSRQRAQTSHQEAQTSWQEAQTSLQRAETSALQHAQSGDLRDLPTPMADYARRGIAMDLEENEPGIRCVAAPVRDAHGRIVAAISVTATTPYMPIERMNALVSPVRDAARRISIGLGARPTA